MPRGLTRFLLEAGFLIAVAVVAGVARLSPAAIVLVMGIAWLLVALIERTATRERSRGAARRTRPPASGEAEATWQPVASELLQRASARDHEPPGAPSGRLSGFDDFDAPLPGAEPGPPLADIESEPEAAVEEPRPPRRGRFWRRRRAVEPELVPPEPRPAPHHVRLIPAEPATPEPVLGPSAGSVVEEAPPRAKPAAIAEASREQVPEPVTAPRAPEPAPLEPATEAFARAERVPRLEPRAGPRQWNIWDLHRSARQHAGRDAARDEEWAFLLMYLRDFADADGRLPADFDSLVRESFAELIGAGEHS